MKELGVFYCGFGHRWQVGTLADNGSEILFEYAAAALERGVQLSPLRLPLRQAAYPDQPGSYKALHGVPGLVYDSLPDGWGFRLLHRRAMARGLNPGGFSALDWLAAMGENTMGALTYEPSKADLHSTQSLALHELAHEVQALECDEGYTVLAELARAGGSPGGARPKAQMYLMPSQQGVGAPSMYTRAKHLPEEEAWLVKFAGADDAPESCVVEEWYARLARMAGLNMCETKLFELPGGRWAFGTRRFDRRGTQRVHVHTLAGLLHANFQVPSVSYEDFLRATRILTRDHREVVKALQIGVFNVLMNNRDDHAKNLSFLQEVDGRWRLAPPYDLTWCPGYQGEHFMDWKGEGRAPGRKHVLAVAQAAGLPATVAERALDDVLARVTPDEVVQQARLLPLPRVAIERVHQAVLTHHPRLRG